ncbi:MAG: proton-conducting membrane transporter [Oscillospiraceae bacterium]|nr:proton-conducting membrane transporter [Oscillospiraceae bacterium]
MLTFFVIIPVFIAVFLFVFSSAKTARILAIGFQAALTVWAFYLLLLCREAEVVTAVGDYAGVLGIFLRADSLAAAFVLLTSVIFLVLSIYALHEDNSRLFWFLLFLLEGALIGLFLTRDFFNIFVLVEVSTVVVAILLMYDRKRRNMAAGMKFLMVNIIVMQFYLFGLGYLYMLTGVLDMEAAASVIQTLNPRDLALPYALIMTSIAAKCSLLPLLTWLPKVNTMPGARSSIAAIMSGLHIKSGIYLFIRFQEVFGGMASDLFLVIGVLTAIAGVALALTQTDIKLILAYSTVAQVGLIITGLSVGSGYSYMGALFHVINHAIFKVALFLGAGMIIRLYQTRDIRNIRGLWRGSRMISIATVMAIFGIIGAPFFNGSVSKYLLGASVSGALEWVIILINLGTILVFLKYAAMFFGTPPEKLETSSAWRCKLGAILGLGALCLGLGLFGEQAIAFIFNAQVSVDALGYLEKSLIFAASLGVGFVLYRYVLAKRLDSARPILQRLKALDFGFGVLCASMGVFFAVVLVVVGVWGA